MKPYTVQGMKFSCLPQDRAFLNGAENLQLPPLLSKLVQQAAAPQKEEKTPNIEPTA